MTELPRSMDDYPPDGQENARDCLIPLAFLALIIAGILWLAGAF